MLGAPLPNCSVVFFHHVEKTAGTTLRALFQRHAQLGLFDLISFVGRQNRLQLQLVLQRLHSLLRSGTLQGLRLAVELHVAGDLTFPYTLYYTMPDLVLIREQLRAAGCRCNLVSLLRMPLLQSLSWHSHFVTTKSPLCVWPPAPDCGTRMALGLTCHDAPRVPPLSEEHAAGAEGMWRLFDLVGVTEMFDEFVLLLGDLVGLPHLAYRAQLVDRVTATATAQRRRRWSAQRCGKLVARPPHDLLQLVGRKLNISREQAGRQRRRMECSTYGCLLRGAVVSSSNSVPYDHAACEAVSAMQVLERLCGRVSVDERVYHAVRARFKQQLAARLSTAQLGRRLKKLSASNEALSARAVRQERKLRSARSALASCVGCSGDVVPEFDLGGCWPLWEQFAPDERRFQCSRTWTTDPAYRDPAVRPGYREKPSVLHTPMACWRTCWTPTGLVAANKMRHRTHVSCTFPPRAVVTRRPPLPSRATSQAGDTAHCTAPCPAAAPLPLEWRAEWDRELAASAARPGASQELAALAAPFRARARGGWHSSYLTRQIFRVF